MSEVIDFKKFKSDKAQDEKLNDYYNLSRALKRCYLTLRPFFKYKPIFIMGKNLVDLRRTVLEELKDLRRKTSNDV